MKALLISALLASSFASFATESNSTIKCYFTEPFIATELSSDLSELSISNYGDPVVKEKILIKYNSEMSTVIKTQNYVLTIDKTKKGNDGMSDVEYDYEGVLTTTANPYLFGGCNKQ